MFIGNFLISIQVLLIVFWMAFWLQNVGGCDPLEVPM